MNKTCVKVLFLSRLTWIQEGLKWWRLHPETMATSDMDIINNNNNNNIYIVCLHAIGRVGLEQARDSYEIVFTVSTFVFGVHYYMYDLIFPCSYMSDL